MYFIVEIKIVVTSMAENYIPALLDIIWVIHDNICINL